MSFNPLPMSNRQRIARDTQHAYNMLDLINQRGNFDAQPQGKYDYLGRMEALQRRSQNYENNALDRLRAIHASTPNPNIIMNRNPVAGLAKNQRVSPNGPGDLIRFIASEVAQESGGRYGAVSSAGALGKYQIMPGNVPSWSQQILGRSISPQKFLHSPKLQDQIGQGKLREYFKKYGAAGAASAWFSGSPTAYKSNPQVAAYVNAVLRRMKGYT